MVIGYKATRNSKCLGQLIWKNMNMILTTIELNKKILMVIG